MDQSSQPAVLVVEDDALLRWCAVDILEQSGLAAIEASNADEALTILEKNGPASILFTDVNMPGSIDGLRLAEIAAERWPEMLVIISSGHYGLEDMAMPGGAQFLPKPYDEPTLARTIARHLTA